MIRSAMTLEELEGQIAELEANGRWSDVARALEQRADLTDDEQSIPALLRLMQLYRERFSNHALAMRAAERIVQIDPRQDAVAYLREIYVFRREHDKLAWLERQLEGQTRGPYR